MATAEHRTGTAEEIARGYFEAIAKRDALAAAGFWHPDGIDDFVSMRVLRGPAEIRAFFEQMFAALPDAEFKVTRVTADDRVAVVEWRLTGTFSGGSFEGMDATGRPIHIRGVDCVEVENGQIVKNTAYSDGASFARQAGMLPPKDSGAERAMLSAFNGATKLRSRLREALER